VIVKFGITGLMRNLSVNLTYVKKENFSEIILLNVELVVLEKMKELAIIIMLKHLMAEK
jgi:hypothetical protein